MRSLLLVLALTAACQAVATPLHPLLRVSRNPFLTRVQQSCSDDAPKVQYVAVIESLCPYCRDFMVDQLDPTWKELRDIMHVDIIPYGNAYDTPNGDGYTFTCQHGDNECRGNMLMACARKHIPCRCAYVDYALCVMTSAYPPDAEAECAAQFPDIDNAAIAACTSSVEGEQALHDMGVLQDSLQPTPNYVPWIIVEGEHTDALQGMAQGDLKGLTCDLYTGEKPAACA